jgi:multisubunit Na+/H+ antiporter MnhE subunit
MLILIILIWIIFVEFKICDMMDFILLLISCSFSFTLYFFILSKNSIKLSSFYYSSTKIKYTAKVSIRVMIYVLWLIGQIIISSFNTFLRVWNIKIDPQIYMINIPIKNNVIITVMAHSITLTPGTVTIGQCDDDSLLIHSLQHSNNNVLIKRILSTFCST